MNLIRQFRMRPSPLRAARNKKGAPGRDKDRAGVGCRSGSGERMGIASLEDRGRRADCLVAALDNITRDNGEGKSKGTGYEWLTR